ncbi:MAG: NBR1-Ig-like domain-containing protein [Bellilinea sp.]|jgi:hypothetical protein
MNNSLTGRGVSPYLLISVALITLAVSGCNVAPGSDPLEFDPTAFAQTVESQLTLIAGTAAATVDPSQDQPAVTPTAMIIVRSPQAAGTVVPEFTLTPETPCDRAAAGAILDVTYPDDSRMLPGQPFTKVWRLVNRGRCTWNRDYQVVWVSGERLYSVAQQSMSGEVHPGESVDIAVDMTAPQQPGLYTSYWMLRNPHGEWMGIGPHGNSPFWVRIQVVAAYTPTVTITPSVTPTPVVQASGSASLALNEGFDLDNGSLTNDAGMDAQLVQSAELQYSLQPLNDAVMAVVGESQPLVNDCLSATLSDQPVELQNLAAGSYLCYRSGGGLPGWLKIQQFPSPTAALIFDYLTWVQP